MISHTGCWLTELVFAGLLIHNSFYEPPTLMCFVTLLTSHQTGPLQVHSYAIKKQLKAPPTLRT